MAVTSVTTSMAGAINYTVVTDTSADWPLVANSTYFYDKADRKIYYKDSAGYVVPNPYDHPKSNLTAVTNPTFLDDVNAMFSKGSLWYNTTASDPKVWICVDNAAGNAVWKLLTLTDNNNNLVLPGGLQFAGGFSSATLTANTNDLLISGLAGSSLVRINSTGNFSLTGIVVPDSTKSYFFSIFNVGLIGNIIFKNSDVASTAQNRFLLGADITVQPGEGLSFIYDPVDLRWRSPGKNI